MRLDLIAQGDLPVTVGRYRLTALLGEGGMARVFRAEMAGQLGFRKPAAVKVVLPGRPERMEELQRQLVQEARVGGLLNHPNVVQTFDCGLLDGFPYIAMELVEGVGLSELVRDAGPLAPQHAIDVAIQTCRGLHHAHFATHEGRRLDVIHRDVKPSNILIRGDGVVKVVDFGIAKAQVADAQTTASGMTKGTPSYMSPEQLAAEPLDLRSDLFALGAVIWFALTGRVLFCGGSLTEVMMRIIQVEETLRSLGALEVAERLAPGMGPLLGRLLTRSREARYGTAMELEAALQQVQAGLGSAGGSLARLVSENFPQRQAGEGGPYPGAQSQPGGPRTAARPVPAVAATRSMQSPRPVTTRDFPAAGSVAVLAPAEPIGMTALGQDESDWPFGSETDDDVEDVPLLSTQSRPSFSSPGADHASPGQRAAPASGAAPSAGTHPAREQTPTAATQRPAGSDPGRQDRADRRLARQAAAIRTQRRLLVFLGATLGAMVVLLAFFGWRVLVPDGLRGIGREPQESPEPASAAAGAVEPTPPPGKVLPPTAPGGGGARTPRPAGKDTPGPTARTPKPVRPPQLDPPRATAPPATAAPAPIPTETPAPDPSPTPAPTAAPVPQPPASLHVGHVAVARATLGSSKVIEASVQGPPGTRVTLFVGPQDGPYAEVPMADEGGGRFAARVVFDSPGRMEYWIVASHDAARPSRAMSGSRFEPHVVSVY